MKYGYIILDENMSKDGIKYEFGRRYKSNIEYSSFFGSLFFFSKFH